MLLNILSLSTDNYVPANLMIFTCSEKLTHLVFLSCFWEMFSNSKSCSHISQINALHILHVRQTKIYLRNRALASSFKSSFSLQRGWKYQLWCNLECNLSGRFAVACLWSARLSSTLPTFLTHNSTTNTSGWIQVGSVKTQTCAEAVSSTQYKCSD